ncbi:hypothetical protein [Anaeromyxobacter sp. Fw109-5]|uniref:hypothetical protein n=1 Tax=Anaeromyxobacter sp. (strain Fw109-5) TaxID=404589 RepID=UPI00032401CE|nr:hypothetical protein [Anaeromyxobacter sp. Fw109-5]
MSAPRTRCARPSARFRPRRAAWAAADAGARERPPGPAAARAPVAACATVLALCFTYAFVRYVVFHGEPLASVPLYVTNKAVALGAALLIAAAAARPHAGWARGARSAGLCGAALHALASAVLLDPAYLPKLHGPGGRLSGWAELAILGGAGALVAFGALKLARPPGAPPRVARRVAHVALAIVGVHCAALGARGWMTPAAWPGGLPPITLLGFLAVLAGLAAAAAEARRSAPRPASPPR